MTVRIDRLRRLASGLALLLGVATSPVACGDSAPGDVPLPLPGDSGRSDGMQVDASLPDQSSDGGPLDDDASRDAATEDGSSQDPPSSDADATAPLDADAAHDGDPTTDADAIDPADVGDADGAPGNVSDARNGDTDARYSDVDAGCECTTDDAGGIGNLPLECMCSPGRCLAYDAALRHCPPVFIPEHNSIDIYADCNMVLIHSGNSIGIGGSTYVFDATTHELLGVSGVGDAPTSRCGDAQVFGFRAGTFPPPTCLRTSTAPRCVDAGDGG